MEDSESARFHSLLGNMRLRITHSSLLELVILFLWVPAGEAAAASIRLLPVANALENLYLVDRLDDLQAAASLPLAHVTWVQERSPRAVADWLGQVGTGLPGRFPGAVRGEEGGSLRLDRTREFIESLIGAPRSSCLGPRIPLEGKTGLPSRAVPNRSSM